MLERWPAPDRMPESSCSTLLLAASYVSACAHVHTPQQSSVHVWLRGSLPAVAHACKLGRACLIISMLLGGGAEQAERILCQTLSVRKTCLDLAHMGVWQHCPRCGCRARCQTRRWDGFVMADVECLSKAHRLRRLGSARPQPGASGVRALRSLGSFVQARRSWVA